MKKILLPLLLIFILVDAMNGQSLIIKRSIIATDTITDEGLTFAASSDDAEQENDELDALFDDDIDAGWEGAPEDLNILTAGMRFQNLGLPQGATIDSAFIEVYSHEAKTAEDVSRLTITAEAADHALTFTEDALITDRPRTNAALLWEIKEEWGLWTPHRTPDLKNIVQEVVNRGGWQAGNAIAFIFQGEDQGPSELENTREWESFENIADPEDGGDGQNHPERVPRLLVYFSTGDQTTSIFSIDASKVESLKLYPNPANQEITLELADAKAATIRIFNSTGQLLQEKQTLGKVVQLAIGQLNRGVYIVQAQQNGKIYAQKLIKK